MAALGSGFTAKEGRLALAERCGIKAGRHTAVFHEVEERALVPTPGFSVLSVGVEHRLRRGQAQIVLVGRAENLPCEESQILAFGKAGELRHVVQSDVEQAFYPCTA